MKIPSSASEAEPSAADGGADVTPAAAAALSAPEPAFDASTSACEVAMAELRRLLAVRAESVRRGLWAAPSSKINSSSSAITRALALPARADQSSGLGYSGFATIPTAAMKNGDFSSELGGGVIGTSSSGM